MILNAAPYSYSSPGFVWKELYRLLIDLWVHMEALVVFTKIYQLGCHRSLRKHESAPSSRRQSFLHGILFVLFISLRSIPSKGDKRVTVVLLKL